jgi:hypothetical protein
MDLTALLKDRRFERVKPNLFLLRLNVGMTLFVDLNIFGNPKNNVGCDVGLKNDLSFSFAIDALKLHGGEVYRQSTWKPDAFNTRCQVGRVCEWRPRMSLRISDYGRSGLLTKLGEDLELHILPNVTRYNDSARYLTLLGEDNRLFPWDTCNGAMRAAELIFLGRESGKTQSELSYILSNYEDNIRSGLGRDTRDSDFIGAVSSLYDVHATRMSS